MTKPAAGKTAPAARPATRTATPRLEGRAIQRGLLAGFLAWLVPGAGHWYAGARGRAAIFFGLVLASLGLGIVFDGNLPVYDSRTPVLSFLQVAGSLAAGPVEPALRIAFYGSPPVFRGDDGQVGANPDFEPQLTRRRQRMFRTWSAYGSAYLMAAGLMNLLLVFDAWDIAIGRKE